MFRLIDSGVVKDIISDVASSAHHDVISVIDVYKCIDSAPTVDAAPVVRCKDCVLRSLWNDELVCERIRNVMDGYYHGTTDIVNPDDYCSHGVAQTAQPLQD